MNNQKIIWIDIDGTICDTFRVIAAHFSEKLGISFCIEDITDYNFRKIPILSERTENFHEIFTSYHESRLHEYLHIDGS